MGSKHICQLILFINHKYKHNSTRFWMGMYFFTRNKHRKESILTLSLEHPHNITRIFEHSHRKRCRVIWSCAHVLAQGHPDDEYSVAYILRKPLSTEGELEEIYEKELEQDPNNILVIFHVFVSRGCIHLTVIICSPETARMLSTMFQLVSLSHVMTAQCTFTS
jgi:hypothetical protein